MTTSSPRGVPQRLLPHLPPRSPGARRRATSPKRLVFQSNSAPRDAFARVSKVCRSGPPDVAQAGLPGDHAASARRFLALTRAIACSVQSPGADPVPSPGPVPRVCANLQTTDIVPRLCQRQLDLSARLREPVVSFEGESNRQRLRASVDGRSSQVSRLKLGRCSTNAACCARCGKMGGLDCATAAGVLPSPEAVDGERGARPWPAGAATRIGSWRSSRCSGCARTTAAPGLHHPAGSAHQQRQRRQLVLDVKFLT